MGEIPDGSKVKESVTKAISNLQAEFKREATLFFTEADIASRTNHLIQEELGYPRVYGKDGSPLYLVHHSYPTPFRCYMHKYSFEVKGEEDRTPKGGKYGRGHYDVVVFNPEFLKHCDFELAKGQDYEMVKSELPLILERIGAPAIFYGIELMYNRRPFPSEKSAERWCRGVLQDLRKLEASRIWHDKGFMEVILMLAFSHKSTPEIERAVEERLGDREDLNYYTV